MKLLTCALVLVAQAASADRGGAFREVRAWRGTVAVTVDDSDSERGVSTRMKGSLTAAFGPLPLDADRSTAMTPVWAGRGLRGSMTLATSALDREAGSMMSWAGTGTLAPEAHVEVTLDLAGGTYTIELAPGTVPGTYTADAAGARETRPERVSLGAMRRTFPLPRAARIEQAFTCSFADCYVHGIPAVVQKTSVRVSLVLEPVLEDSEPAAGATRGCRSASPIALAGVLLALALATWRRRAMGFPSASQAL